MDTSDICVPDTWLKRDLHALASASGEGAFSFVQLYAPANNARRSVDP
jgi:hypothetical protein